MNKIRIIDLLNKIANGEELPKKIHIKEFQSDFIFNGYTYLSDEKEQKNIYWCLHSRALNYEVEIIEEDKKIEKLDVALLGQCDNWLQNRVVNTRLDIELNPYIIENIRENTSHFQRGINELRDELNKLKKLIDEANRLKEEK